jgi:hypothetical protein
VTTNHSDKEKYIALLRSEGFNCFPIKKWDKNESNQKQADHRYKASRTEFNQVIRLFENYGYLGIKGNGTGIIDLDNKELYRPFAMYMKEADFMVIETPHGWHIPFKGINGQVQKIELHDYKVREKKIIEIQGPNHFVMGIGSVVWDAETNKEVTYTNIGTDKIYDAKGKNFDDFVDELCKQCNVTSKKTNRSSNRNQRDRFKEDKIPTKGTSNNYFFNAALQCNTDGLTKGEAIKKIKIIYDKWEQSENFSGRSWSNIERKIDDVYDNDIKLKEGRPAGTKNQIDRTLVAKEILSTRKIYSDTENDDIFENQDGYLEKINNELKRDLWTMYPCLEPADYTSIKAKLVGLGQKIPQTNKDLIVFKNGVYSRSIKVIIETDELADIGFKNYNYLEKSKENEPIKFFEILFENIPKEEHSRIKAGLKAILLPYNDPKISIIHGCSGVGKSTPLLILHRILGDYSIVMELDQLLSDHFIKAKIKGRRLLVLQDLPQSFKDFSQLKAITGEQYKTERGFQQDSSTFENKIKIWASANYLPKIPDKEKNAMYERRLSVLHNKRKKSYPENPTLIEEIVNEEGEKIISWILNLSEEECKYEDGKTVKEEWEQIASPEIFWLEKNYEITDEDSPISVMKLVKQFNKENENEISLDILRKALLNQGYVISLNMIKNIRSVT